MAVHLARNVRARTFIIADVETVPDPNISAVHDLKSKIPPPIGCQVVALSMLVGRLETTGYTVEKLCSGKGACESDILKKFWEFFDNRRPLLVTWNGRGFYIPVLVQRSFKLGLPLQGWFSGTRYNSYSYRYSPDHHCDLMDQFTDYGACTKTKLDTMATAIGLPGKIGGHGSEVSAMYEEGRIDDIAAYCESDVLNLYALFVRYSLLTGKLNEAAYGTTLANSAAYLEASETERPHCGLFARWCRAEVEVPRLAA